MFLGSFSNRPEYRQAVSASLRWGRSGTLVDFHSGLNIFSATFPDLCFSSGRLNYLYMTRAAVGWINQGLSKTAALTWSFFCDDGKTCLTTWLINDFTVADGRLSTPFGSARIVSSINFVNSSSTWKGTPTIVSCTRIYALVGDATGACSEVGALPSEVKASAPAWNAYKRPFSRWSAILLLLYSIVHCVQLVRFWS